MHALALTTNFRNADNWLDLFLAIGRTGGRCELLSFPWQGDPSVARMAELETQLPVRKRFELSTLGEDALSRETLAQLLEEACTPEVDVLFLCDVQSYPSRVVYELLSTWPRRPMVIGLQHGLFQSWWLYNAQFCADHMLLFGERHRQFVAPPLRARTSAVGLPKLDRLQNVKTSARGYVAYLAQNVLTPAQLEATFREIHESTGLEVLTRDHPQYPTDGPAPTHGAQDYLGFLADSDWVITPHSTGGIEALYLKKAVALLPNAGLTAWAGYPGVAWQMNAQAMLDARQRVSAHAGDTARFLDDVVGGVRFDHVQRALQAVHELLNAGRTGAPKVSARLTSPPTEETLLAAVDAAVARGQHGVIAHINDLLGPIGPDHRRRNYDRRILFELLSRLELGVGDLLQKGDRPPVLHPTVQVRTDHPIAAHSLDHRQPLGSAQDNTRGLGFCIACEALYGPTVTLLDLGCAGGGVVYDFLMRGHFAVGIEGSDYSRNMGRAAWRIFPDRLFTADITKRFDVLHQDGTPIQFGVVSCWEVLEHIAEPDLDAYFDNVQRHLQPGGLYIGTVAFSESPYHQTVRPKEWWMERLGQVFDLVDPMPFRKEQLTRGVAAGLFDSADYFENPARGWHFCYRGRAAVAG